MIRSTNMEHVEVLRDIRNWMASFYWDSRVDALDAAIASLSAPQPSAEAQACGCGEATCTVPWEPGCGLGKSEQHAEAQAQGGGEVVTWWNPDAEFSDPFSQSQTRKHRIALYAAPPSAPVGVEGAPRADYQPAFDTPTTASEALAWLSKQGEPTCMTFSADKARRAAELLRDALQQPATDSATASVFAELDRAVRKFPTWPTDPLHAVAVLGEEFGELTKAVLQSVYEPHKVKPGEVRQEALQTAAMALRFLRSVDAYEFAPGAQHEQPALARQPAAEAQPVKVEGVEVALQKWLDWCNEHDEEPEAWAGARVAIEALADQQPEVPTWIGIDWAAGQQPAAVNEATVERACKAAVAQCAPNEVWPDNYEEADDLRAMMKAALTAALAAQPGGSDNDR